MSRCSIHIRACAIRIATYDQQSLNIDTPLLLLMAPPCPHHTTICCTSYQNVRSGWILWRNSPHPLNATEQKPKGPKWIRGTPPDLDPSTFDNEVEKDKVVPYKCCAVCCRLLYLEDYCKLSEPHKMRIEDMFVKDMQTALECGKTLPDIEKITWPLLKLPWPQWNQKRLDTHIPKNKGKEAKYVIVCARH